MTETKTPPTWLINVECVREELMQKLFDTANASVHEYMQQLIVHYGNDTTAIATTADTALYQVRSATGAALALVGSTVSAGGVVRVHMHGCVSYQHAEADTLSITVDNVVANTAQEGGDTNDETKEQSASGTSTTAVDGIADSTDETPAEDTETVETADSATTTQADTATTENTTEGTAK